MARGVFAFFLTATVSLSALNAMASPLPNGVAAGDVSQDSVVLWGRSENPGNLNFEISTDASFSTSLGSPISMAVSDALQPVKTQVTGLTAGTQYYYRATDAAGNSSTGAFKTANPTDQRYGLSFGVSGDWRGELAPYPAVRNAAGKSLDFFVELGDTIYSDYASPAVPKPQAETITDFRAKYAETMTEKYGQNTIVDLRQSTAVYAMIDDHEVTDNFAGGAHPSSDPRFAGDPVAANPNSHISDTQLYKTGLQAFSEYMPIQDKVNSGAGDSRVDGKPDLYRTQTFGKDAAMFMVDARTFRDPEVAAGSPASLDPNRTLLGKPQLERLKSDLLASQADGALWKFVMLPEPIQNFGPLAAEDRYEGYSPERNELLKFIADNNISNVVFATADIHGTVVNNLTYSDGGVQKSVKAWEISTGSVAFSEPFSPTIRSFLPALIAQLQGLGNAAGAAQLQALYDAYPFLPGTSDSDSAINDQNDLIKAVLNQQLAQYGYDPIGLGGAAGIVAELLQGDYLAGASFGWTQFDIDPITGALLVTTYGIPAYTPNQVSPTAPYLNLDPAIVSQFRVQATFVPEPGELGLLGLGLTALAAGRRKRMK